MKIVKSLLSLILASNPVTAIAQSTAQSGNAQANTTTKTQTNQSIMDRLNFNLGYQFETRTSNKLGSERAKNTLRNAALFGVGYNLRHVTLGLDGSLSKVERSENQDNSAVKVSSYRGKVISPSVSFRTRNLSVNAAAQYTNTDSQLFEVTGREEPSLAGNLDVLAGSDLKLKAALAGRTNTNQTIEHSLGYLGLRSGILNDLYGDLGVAHENNEFYSQSATYGVLGLDSSNKNTSVRTELGAGEKFSAKLNLVAKLRDYVGLNLIVSASKEPGEVRRVEDVSVTAGLVFR